MRHVDAVAITDHNEISGAQEFKPFLEKRGIAVIVGEEIFTAEGEIIGLFLSNRIEPGLTPEETVAEIRRQNGLVYIPHPFDEKRVKTVLSLDALKRVANEVDCIEIHNGRNARKEFSEKQLSTANSVGALHVVGEDAHCFFELGRNCCITEEPFSRDSFISVLRTASFRKKTCHPLAHFSTKVIRLTKLLMGGDCDEIARILHRKLSR